MFQKAISAIILCVFFINTISLSYADDSKVKVRVAVDTEKAPEVVVASEGASSILSLPSVPSHLSIEEKAKLLADDIADYILGHTNEFRFSESQGLRSSDRVLSLARTTAGVELKNVEENRSELKLLLIGSAVLGALAANFYLNYQDSIVSAEVLRAASQVTEVIHNKSYGVGGYDGINARGDMLFAFRQLVRDAESTVSFNWAMSTGFGISSLIPLSLSAVASAELYAQKRKLNKFLKPFWKQIEKRGIPVAKENRDEWLSSVLKSHTFELHTFIRSEETLHLATLQAEKVHKKLLDLHLSEDELQLLNSIQLFESNKGDFADKVLKCVLYREGLYAFAKDLNLEKRLGFNIDNAFKVTAEILRKSESEAFLQVVSASQDAVRMIRDIGSTFWTDTILEYYSKELGIHESNSSKASISVSPLKVKVAKKGSMAGGILSSELTFNNAKIPFSFFYKEISDSLATGTEVQWSEEIFQSKAWVDSFKEALGSAIEEDRAVVASSSSSDPCQQILQKDEVKEEMEVLAGSSRDSVRKSSFQGH